MDIVQLEDRPVLTADQIPNSRRKTPSEVPAAEFPPLAATLDIVAPPPEEEDESDLAYVFQFPVTKTVTAVFVDAGRLESLPLPELDD